MFLDLHGLARHATGNDPPWVGREVASGLQTVIILSASVYRFFLNECRRDADNKRSWSASVVGLLCWLLSAGVFIFCTANLLIQAGHWDSIATDTEAGIVQQRDCIAVWIIMVVQIGYPVVSVLSWLMLHFAADRRKDASKKWFTMPGNQYHPWVSLLKDMAYSSLDVTTKGGLAFYAVLRAGFVV